MSRKPINRHIAIQPISRDHHQGLLIGWKIRTGIRQGVSPDRIYNYLKWFYEKYQKLHFKKEERYLFPILGDDHEEVIRAKNDHVKIHDFFKRKEVSKQDLLEFDKLLTSHIRFEERVLFNILQKQASEQQLKDLIRHIKDHAFVENSEDEFWLNSDKS